MNCLRWLWRKLFKKKSHTPTLATKIFYGDESTDPEEFTGFAHRYNSLSAENGEAARNQR
jgi:hypothetical protein